MIEDYQSLPSFKKTKRILTIAYAEAFEGQLTCKLLTTQKVEERLTLADSFLKSSSRLGSSRYQSMRRGRSKTPKS